MKSIAVAFTCFFLVLVASGCVSQNDTGNEYELGEACFKGACFQVEIPGDDDEMRKGLMHRESMDQEKGMLFVFNNDGIHPFWMKNTTIPLDIIWMDGDGKVVFISRDAEPCESDPCASINPGRKALYVLEINAGISERIGLRVGERMDIRL
jgi:uncharacterized membrane protein (UPF0127 family)